MNRSIDKIIQTVNVLEGGGFPVRRPFPTDELDQVDPFLLLDHLGPIEWGRARRLAHLTIHTAVLKQ